jgi:hypothetical protein
MKAIVVYESLWGNTAAIAHAIAEGIGPQAEAMSTAEATGAAVADADLIVAGAPVLGFNLSTEQMRESIRANSRNAPAPPNLAHPSMRAWLAQLPAGHGRAAWFETAIWWSPSGARSGITRGLDRAGYGPVVKGQRFVVTGRYGPLRNGEVERARQWGAELALAMRQNEQAIENEANMER